MKAPKSPTRKTVKRQTKTSGQLDPGPTAPALEEVRLRAYEIYIRRGQADGQDLEDWLQAEKEVAEDIRKRKSA
jgi:hypothetical protein